MAEETPTAPAVVPELPPVPVTPAEGLSLLKDLTISLWIEWGADPTDNIALFMSYLADILKKPLVSFDEGYDQFIKSISNATDSNDMGDLWRVFQLAFLTELGEHREKILNEFIRMVRRTMLDFEDGEKLMIKSLVKPDTQVPSDWLPSVHMKLGAVILLCVKVYGSGVRVREVEKK